MKEHIIDKVLPGSIAEELEIEPGDILLSINQQEIQDVFDYQYYIQEENLLVLIRKSNGEEWELEIEKDEQEDLGIVFENGLMDDYKSCRNKCIFCFIDQMPQGMRETLYFKDDDTRLSFLQGNYVTLTNLKESDIQRIIQYHLAPINISVQTTNPKLRCEMLKNRFAGEALKKIDTLYQAGISMNGQVVLCKGVNDKKELENTILDLMKYMPVMESVSVVPVGLSKHRQGLHPLEPFTKEDAIEVLDLIHQYQKLCVAKCGLHFIHASDEWYLLAERPLPLAEIYDGYLQLENGVGMLRLLQEEFQEALEKTEEFSLEKTVKVSIATGTLAAPILEKLSKDFQKRFPQIQVEVYPITNYFFGEQITVSGLITAQDLMQQLAGKNLGEKLLIPCNMLRREEEIFLDDMTLQQVEEALQIPICVVSSQGKDLLSSLLGHSGEEKRSGEINI